MPTLIINSTIFRTICPENNHKIIEILEEITENLHDNCSHWYKKVFKKMIKIINNDFILRKILILYLPR
jgi:hypothetical protein